MADPLSITGSTVGIIALGLTVVKSLYNFSNGVLLASKEIQDLRTDTETLKEILDRFHNIFNKTDPYSMTFDLQFLEKIVWRYRDKFAELDTRLETFTADRKSRGRRTLEKLKWIVERDDLRELLNQVGKMKTDLQTALLLSQRQTLGEMSYQQKLQAYDLHCIRRESINVKDHLANIHDTTERINEELYAFTSPRLLEISNGIATTTDELQGMRSEVHTCMELVMRRLSEYKNDIIRSVELVSKRKGGARDVILGRKRKIVQSVRCALGSLIFTTAIATKNYHFSNFTTQTKRKNRTFMYFLPSFRFWSAGLAVSFASTPFQVSLSLPTRRYIPYGNKAFEYCEKGDLTALRWMVESREILVSDIELDDGGSDKVSPRSRGTLLHVAARHGYRDICDFLVSQGADPEFTVKIYYPETPMATVGMMLIPKEISAQELANPLFMPSTFGHWDEPCPSGHSFGMFISRMWEQNPDITPEMVHGAIKHFTSMMEPELKTQCQVDVTNSFAYGMTCMSVHGTPSFASYEKILSSIHHYDELQSISGGFDEKIGRTPTGIVSWRVENAQSTNKTPCQIHKSQFQNSRKQKGSLQFPISSTMHSSHRQLMERSCTLEQGLSSSWNDIVFQSSGWYRQLFDSNYNPRVEVEIVSRLRYLINLGLDINVQDVAGRTPLHKLLMLGHNVRTAIRIRIRILAGADPTIIDSHSWPPLFYGIVFGHIPALVQLLNTTSNTDAVLHKARLLAHATLNAARNAPTDTSIAINDTEWQKWPQWMCSTLDIPIPWQDFRKARGVSKALLIRQYQCVVDIVQYFIDHSHAKADEELENVLWNMDAGNPDVILDPPNDDILHRLEALLRRRLDNPCPTSSGKPTKDNGTTSMDEKQEQSNAEGFSFMVAVSFSTNVVLMVMLGCILLPAFV